MPINEIKNAQELRSVVSMLTGKINNMCNSATADDVAANFVDAKDFLIAIYKFNVARTKDSVK